MVSLVPLYRPQTFSQNGICSLEVIFGPNSKLFSPRHLSVFSPVGLEKNLDFCSKRSFHIGKMGKSLAMDHHDSSYVFFSRGSDSYNFISDAAHGRALPQNLLPVFVFICPLTAQDLLPLFPNVTRTTVKNGNNEGICLHGPFSMCNTLITDSKFRIGRSISAGS